MAYGAEQVPADGIHRVVSGDTISSIAAFYGITEWEARVWNAPENAKLKESRQDPNQLMPGDQVAIPKLKDKQEPRPVDAWHDFHVVRNKRFIRLKLQYADDSAIANKKYVIEPDKSFRGVYVQQGQTTDKDGQIEEEVPHTMLEATLTLPEESLHVKLKIGYLEPIPATDPVKAPSMDVAGALSGALSGAPAALAGIASGAGGDLAGAAKGALGGALGGGASGGASGGFSLGSGGAKGGLSGGLSGMASGIGGAAGGLAGQAKGIGGAAAQKLLASGSSMMGGAAKAVAGALGLDSLGKETDPNIYPAAQRLNSMGFKAGDPTNNKRTAQFSTALMSFQTWCKKQGQMADSAGGPLGSLTSPGGILGGGGGPLGDLAGAVAGPMLAAVGLTGQLDEDTVTALKKTHGC